MKATTQAYPETSIPTAESLTPRPSAISVMRPIGIDSEELNTKAAIVSATTGSQLFFLSTIIT